MTARNIVARIAKFGLEPVLFKTSCKHHSCTSCNKPFPPTTINPTVKHLCIHTGVLVSVGLFTAQESRGKMREIALCVCGKKKNFLSHHCLFVLAQTETACHARIVQVVCRYTVVCGAQFAVLCLVEIITRFFQNWTLSIHSLNAKCVCLSVHIPLVQSAPSPFHIVSTTHLCVFLCSASFLLCVFGLGPVVPVSNTVMETRLVFPQPQKHRQTEGQGHSDRSLFSQSAYRTSCCLFDILAAEESKWLDESAPLCTLTKQKRDSWKSQDTSWCRYVPGVLWTLTVDVDWKDGVLGLAKTTFPFVEVIPGYRWLWASH